MLYLNKKWFKKNTKRDLIKKLPPTYELPTHMIKQKNIQHFKS
ncbi:uncharacterized protein METZ01_LOCUS58040 [marine metagenome]|uniref:Uncharacterized protein n=1 Tax=marine metagenome TaxID=408172 RepID=A0A381SMF5_9ZZZZ